jgi:hypothetical protein
MGHPRFLDHPRIYDFGAALLAAGLSVFEIVRMIVSGGITGGHNMLSTLIGGVIFSAVLGAAAIGLTLHRRFGWLFGVFGVIVASAHGIVIRAAGAHIGILYMLSAFVLLGLIVKSLHEYTTEAVPST